mmetsp:Transcript_5114/g.10618  ORF Transcript_5114/g.10618 Transcript_5114/m.10618 type:complete len:83 (+) Transcript_5114:452-700(+)|eukprot:CAMPEP_0171496418 /NCGR_PEP_ID=MMETSP0958-20121227/6694_1 /TAXON_ID=87120 /ORGANISM="Aurantiochytrium limacinum, Strain ATCCMYA-1381" /LENGTH=82 /DNA_ID=CAMNT_0012030525 /DNA_START=56 /DNA_END=304 /DNA_ORIENTATION=+
MSGQVSPEQQQQLLAQVRGEVQAAALQELFTKISEKCFIKCVPKPGSKLSSSEQKCLAMCMDRYMDTMNVVSQAMVQRGQQQ